MHTNDSRSFQKHIPLKFLEIFSLNSTQPKEKVLDIT